ncbi:transposable element Tc3 transposase [Trichonephila clavipes]|nr:transposable element Tc3 transposase [Trichonephila clavipes]
MITNFFIPELNNHDVQELWFQQDGATCYTARATVDLLKDTFGDRLISRFRAVNWPPRSCHLTPLDYFLGGYVKEQQRLRHLLGTVSTDSEDEISDFQDCVNSEEEEHHIEQSDHSTDTEQELEGTCEQETTNNLIENDSYYLGKDGITKWFKNKGNTSVHTRSHNIVIHLPGAKGSAKTFFPEKEMRRSRLLEDIGMCLVKPQLDMRSELPSLDKKLKRGLYARRPVFPSTDDSECWAREHVSWTQNNGLCCSFYNESDSGRIGGNSALDTINPTLLKDTVIEVVESWFGQGSRSVATLTCMCSMEEP